MSMPFSAPVTTVLLFTGSNLFVTFAQGLLTNSALQDVYAGFQRRIL